VALKRGVETELSEVHEGGELHDLGYHFYCYGSCPVFFDLDIGRLSRNIRWSGCIRLAVERSFAWKKERLPHCSVQNPGVILQLDKKLEERTRK
jgi:hypothetical protein